MPLAPKPRLATYADIEALPPNRVGEIVHGVLLAHPRPRPRHAKATSELGAELIAPFGRGGPGGWIILDEPELHLGADAVAAPPFEAHTFDVSVLWPEDAGTLPA